MTIEVHRENNMQKMREALKRAKTILSGIATLSSDQESRKGAKWLLDEWVAPALFASPRNCDVGTSDEQAERFENFCLKHIGCAEETGGRHCVGCPLEKASRNITQKCELYWAQMPYEE